MFEERINYNFGEYNKECYSTRFTDFQGIKVDEEMC